MDKLHPIRQELLLTVERSDDQLSSMWLHRTPTGWIRLEQDWNVANWGHWDDSVRHSCNGDFHYFQWTFKNMASYHCPKSTESDAEEKELTFK